MTCSSMSVTDAASGEPLGLFYLDMFPREGKFDHFAQFEIVERQAICRTENISGRPCASFCNFPPPAGDKPSC